VRIVEQIFVISILICVKLKPCIDIFSAQFTFLIVKSVDFYLYDYFQTIFTDEFIQKKMSSFAKIRKMAKD
jgi:hypothetical protein